MPTIKQEKQHTEKQNLRAKRKRKRGLLKVGNVWYPQTKEGIKQAHDALKWRHEGWITEMRKTRRVKGR